MQISATLADQGSRKRFFFFVNTVGIFIFDLLAVLVCASRSRCGTFQKGAPAPYCKIVSGNFAKRSNLTKNWGTPLPPPPLLIYAPGYHYAYEFIIADSATRCQQYARPLHLIWLKGSCYQVWRFLRRFPMTSPAQPYMGCLRMSKGIQPAMFVNTGDSSVITIHVCFGFRLNSKNGVHIGLCL